MSENQQRSISFDSVLDMWHTDAFGNLAQTQLVSCPGLSRHAGKTDVHVCRLIR